MIVLLLFAALFVIIVTFNMIMDDVENGNVSPLFMLIMIMLTSATWTFFYYLTH